MTTYEDKYKPIGVTVEMHRNCIVKRIVTRINRLAESRSDGENVRYVNTLQPEMDFCTDRMVVDDAIEDGYMRVMKRIEPYVADYAEEGEIHPTETDLSVIPDHLEFAYHGGTKTFVVQTIHGNVLNVVGDGSSTGCAGGSSVLTGDGVAAGDTAYTLTLAMPYNWKRQFAGMLRKRIAEYMVTHVIAEWMELVSPNEAAHWAEKAEDLLYEVRNVCDMRQGKIHIGWNTTY